MEWKERITLNPAVLAGKPVIKGTRLAVDFIVELLAEGWTEEQVLENYPGVTREDIRSCLAYARRCGRRRCTRLGHDMQPLRRACSAMERRYNLRYGRKHGQSD